MPHIYEFLFPWPKQESISLFNNRFEGKDFDLTKGILPVIRQIKTRKISMPHIYEFLFPWPKQESSISLFNKRYEGKDFGSTKRINKKCIICLKNASKKTRNI